MANRKDKCCNISCDCQTTTVTSRNLIQESSLPILSSDLICHLQTHLPFSLLFWPPLTNSPSISHYSSQQVLSSTSHQCAGYITWLAPMFVFFKLSWLKIRTKKLGIQYLAQSNSIFRTLFWALQLQLFPTLIKSASESLVLELLVHFMAHPIG